MDFLSTVHSHTTYCDGDNSPDEMAKKAYELGFVSYGFSAHSHLPYDAGYDIQKENEPLYRKDVLRLKKEYADKMEILLGLELDADSDYPDFKYDFLISSVHQLHKNGQWYAVDHCKADFDKCLAAFGGIENMFKEFFAATVTAALRDNIDIVGHFDLVTKFNENNLYFDPNTKEYLDLAFSAIDAILEQKPDIVFEVNTGAMSRGYRTSPYPDIPILEYLAKKGVRLTLNSDTHAINSLDYAYDKAVTHLKKVGVTKIYRLRKDGFEEIIL